MSDRRAPQSFPAALELDPEAHYIAKDERVRIRWRVRMDERA